MKKHILALFILAAMTAGLSAQTPSYRAVLDGLAQADPNAPVQLPSAFFKYSESNPLGQLQRGIVLYAAIGRARECGNLERIPVLLAEAKTLLLAAHAGLSSAQADQKSQCMYYLGLVAEKHEGNLSAAKDYYAQAASLKGNAGVAYDAMRRVSRATEK